MGPDHHQDWNTVVFKKRAPVKHVAQNAPATMSSVANKPAFKIEKQVDSDSGKPVTYVSSQDAQEIIKLRTSRGLTQDQLAVAINFPRQKINEIESRKAIENKNDLIKIKRYLEKMPLKPQ
jgi:ribosome-binding protein aMBF1 (putative translation factor)